MILQADAHPISIIFCLENCLQHVDWSELGGVSGGTGCAAG